MKNNLLIPLRLVLNTNCNGYCCYCHREGTHTNIDMPIETIVTCAEIAKERLLPISLTGGEPSLRSDLATIINAIYDIESTINLSLTSNGYKLINHLDIEQPINTLNLSITSFDANIASHYQNVLPDKALRAFKMFPAINKNLNIVISADNYLELEGFIEYCTLNKCNLDIMFELKNYSSKEIQIQQYVFKKLEEIGNAIVIMKPSPIIEIITDDQCKIRVKHPFLSALPQFGICKECVEIGNCFERICSVRVYPDGQVSPCLSQFIKPTDGSLRDNIEMVYSRINADISLLSFITNN